MYFAIKKDCFTEKTWRNEMQEVIPEGHANIHLIHATKNFPFQPVEKLPEN
jgi:hypothetical protein